jgi:hypothetical protein
VLVFASFGENAGFLGGFLEATERTLDRFAWCDAYFHRTTLPSARRKRRHKITDAR